MSTIIVKKVSHLSDLLKPTQVGFGIRGGCEAAAHAVRIYSNDCKNQDHVIMKVDFLMRSTI